MGLGRKGHCLQHNERCSALRMMIRKHFLFVVWTGSKPLGYSRTLVSDWSEEDVCEWLRDEGFEALVDAFRAHNIDGAELVTLNTETLTTAFNIGEETHKTLQTLSLMLYYKF